MEHRPLSPEDVRQLEALPVGGRIRLLRDRRGSSQNDVLDALAKPLERRPSIGWISGIEKGTLRLQDKYVEPLCAALGLPREHWELLNPESSIELPLDLVQYGAWQAVRLHLATSYVMLVGKSHVHQAKASQQLVRDALRREPATQRLEAAGWDVLNLHAYMDRAQRSAHDPLPTGLRLMLLVEGMHAEPYHPIGPGTWLIRRRMVIGNLAQSLRLEVGPESPEGTRIRQLRNTSIGATSIGALAGGKAGPPKVSPPGLGTVARVLMDEESLDLVAAGSLVGEYGWPFACGQYLLDIDSVTTLRPPSWTPAARRRHLPDSAQSAPEPNDERAARLLWAIGDDGLRNDLAKLWTMSYLAGRFTVPELDAFQSPAVRDGLEVLKGRLGAGRRHVPHLSKHIGARIKLLGALLDDM